MPPAPIVKQNTSPSYKYVVRYTETDPKDPITYPRTAFDHNRAYTSPPRPQKFESRLSLGQPTQERAHALTWLKGIRGARPQSVDVDSSPTVSLTSRTTRYISNIRKEFPVMDIAKCPVETPDLHTPSYQHLHLDLTHSDTSFSSQPVLKLPTRPSLASTNALPLKQKRQKLVRILQPISKNLSLGRKPRSTSSVRQQLPTAVAQSANFAEGQSDPSSSQTTVTGDAPSSLKTASRRQSSEISHPPPRQLEAGATNSKDEETNPIQINTPSSVSLCKSPDRSLPPLSTSPPAHRRPISNPTVYDARRRTLSQIDLSGPRENHVQFQWQKRPTTAPAAFPAPFQVNAIPSQRQLSAAASLTVVAENGFRCPFGDLFLRSKTVVIFIRHFWCPLCQDYVYSISRNVNPAVLKKAGVKLVIISNGSHNMIKGYRKIFRLPFEVYTDPQHRIYNALGMTLRSSDPGPDSQKGGYVRHGTVGGITMVVLNAIKVKMPVWEKGGDIEQLGGEFVLGPGLQCSFAHRMRNTRSHSSIQHVLAAAGVDVCVKVSPGRALDETSMSESEELQWMEERKRSLAKLRSKKTFRRGEYIYGDVDSDTEDTAVSIAAERSSDGGDAVSDVVFIAPEAPVAVAEENVALDGETGGTCNAYRGDDDAIDQFPTHRQSVASDGELYDFFKPGADDVSSIDSGTYWDYYSDRNCHTDEA